MTEETPTQEKLQEKPKEKKKIEAKPLPVDKEKARAIERGEKIDETPQQDKKPKEPTTPEPKTQYPDNKGGAAEKPEKKEKKKSVPVIKKEDAVARGSAVPISKKQAMYICKFIKNKEIDQAISDLTKVIMLKQAVPFKGEIPHRKGKGMMSGRYPVKASRYFINLLKALKGNAIVNGLELEKTRIAEASASWAARPMRTRSRSAKRTNVILKAKEVKK